jgi:hypothetical protein
VTDATAELWCANWFASSLDLADGAEVAEVPGGMSSEEFALWLRYADRSTPP